MIRVEDLSVRAGEFSLTNVSFEIPQGQYGILMGRTGSGKTTILESLCGLKRIETGRILLMERDVTNLKPAERGIGFVPQDGALFPTMTVEQQLGFALSIRHWKPRAIRPRVKELAELLGITPLLPRTIEGLSGGERQRIALGRALAASPDVLCLDEPLSALDESTRGGMYELLKTIQQQTGVTTLHITHSRTEARKLGDVLLKIEEGQVVRAEDDAKTPGFESNGDENGESVEEAVDAIADISQS